MTRDDEGSIKTEAITQVLENSSLVVVRSSSLPSSGGGGGPLPHQQQQRCSPGGNSVYDQPQEGEDLHMVVDKIEMPGSGQNVMQHHQGSGGTTSSANTNNVCHMSSTGGGSVGGGCGGGSSYSVGRRTSRVWLYFRMVDQYHYACQLCQFVGTYTNTTNMRKHIQHHHPQSYQDILDHTRPTNRPSLQYYQAVATHHHHQQQHHQHQQNSANEYSGQQHQQQYQARLPPAFPNERDGLMPQINNYSGTRQSSFNNNNNPSVVSFETISTAEKTNNPLDRNYCEKYGSASSSGGGGRYSMADDHVAAMSGSQFSQCNSNSADESYCKMGNSHHISSSSSSNQQQHQPQQHALRIATACSSNAPESMLLHKRSLSSQQFVKLPERKRSLTDTSTDTTRSSLFDLNLQIKRSNSNPSNSESFSDHEEHTTQDENKFMCSNISKRGRGKFYKMLIEESNFSAAATEGKTFSDVSNHVEHIYLRMYCSSFNYLWGKGFS